MTIEEAIRLIERKLARREFLNQPEVRRHRAAQAPAPQSIALTFDEARAVIEALERVACVTAEE